MLRHDPPNESGILRTEVSANHNGASMQEAMTGLIAAGRQVIALLRAGESLSRKDYALLASLAWRLLAALHARKPLEESVQEQLPSPPPDPGRPPQDNS